MGLVNYPDHFNLISSIIDNHANGLTNCGLVDFTNWASFPPPHYNMTLSPRSIRIEPGKEKL